MNSGFQACYTTTKSLDGNEDPLTVLEQTPSITVRAILGVPAAALKHKPGPNEWSVAEILAHQADSELVFGYRLRMILAAGGSPLPAFDPDRFAATFDYASIDVQQSARLFAALRTGTLRLLRSVPDALLENTGEHEEWGTATARGLLRLEAGHDMHHLAQIRGILAGLDAAASFTPAERKKEVSPEFAEQLDLRIGTIVDMTEVPDADRLMKLTVDFSSEKRTVIAGIRGERQDPRVLLGRQALFYYNLPPRKIRGHVSEAMLCDVGFADGILPALLEPEWPVPDGTRAG